MVLRSALLLCGLLLAMGLIANAIAPREVTDPEPPRSTPIEPPPAPARTVSGELPEDEVVRARVGDVVALSVRSQEIDVAELAALGLDAPVGPGTSGELRFVAGSPGRYVVRSRFAGEELGVVLVAPATAPRPAPAPARGGADAAEPL